MNKRRHDKNHFGRRTVSLVLVLVTLVALCMPSSMALSDEGDEVRSEQVVTVPEVQADAAEEQAVEPVAEEAAASAEPETQPAEEAAQPDASSSEDESTAEPEPQPTENVGEETAEPVAEPEPQFDTLEQPEDGALAVEAAVDAQALTIADVKVANNIKTSGTLDVSFTSDTEDAANQVTFKWFRSSDNNNYTEVTRTKITGSTYNISADGTKLYAVLDNGAQKYYKVEVWDKDGTTKLAESTPIFVDYYMDVQNGSFETPTITDRNGWQHIAQGTNGLHWKSTGANGTDAIEFGNKDVGSGTYGAYGVSSTAQGSQIAELNCNAEGSLYQDVLTMPGSTMYWQLYHAARLYCYGSQYTGSDTMYVMIMSTVKAEALGQLSQDDITKIVDIVKGTSTNKTYKGVDLTGVSVAKVEDGGEWSGRNTCNRYYVDDAGTKHYYKNENSSTGKVMTNGEWTRWNGEYTVPTNQYMTRFFFVSYKAAQPNITVGNLLDNISFSTEMPDPDPNKGNLTITKTVEGLDELPDDYTVTVEAGLLKHTFTKDNFTASNGTWTASYTFGNVDATTYTVTETASTVQNYTWTANATTKTVTVQDGGTASVDFVNRYEKLTGSLALTKTIENQNALTDDELAKLKENLSFTISGDAGEDTVTGTQGTWTDNTFTYTWDNLPAGSTWTVTESNQNVDYVTVETTYNQQTATIPANDEATLSITNTYTPIMGELTINKTVTGSNSKPGSFTFTAVSERTGITYTATIVTKDDGTATISGIPAGKYTVTELENDNYTCTGGSVKTAIVNPSDAVSFTNNGTGDSFQDSSSVVNVGKKNGYHVKFTVKGKPEEKNTDSGDNTSEN